MWHKALLMRLELTLVRSLNVFSVRLWKNNLYIFFFFECVYFSFLYLSLIFGMFLSFSVSVCVCVLEWFWVSLTVIFLLCVCVNACLGDFLYVWQCGFKFTGNSSLF